MIKNYWKRFNNYEKLLSGFFVTNIFLVIINKEFLSSVIPIEIVGYSFLLSLGLYLGFRLCKYEYGRITKMQMEEQREALHQRLMQMFTL